MTASSLLSAGDLHSKWWLLLGGQASGLYATTYIMTLGSSDFDLLAECDLQSDLDLDVK